jgi:hypothetical protein
MIFVKFCIDDLAGTDPQSYFRSPGNQGSNGCVGGRTSVVNPAVAGKTRYFHCRQTDAPEGQFRTVIASDRARVRD